MTSDTKTNDLLESQLDKYAETLDDAGRRIAELESQIAEMRIRERKQKARMGEWLGSYIELLIVLCETPGNEFMAELLQPQFNRIHKAVTEAQSKQAAERGTEE